ncbi:TetR/AcrR family transcriptional regulator [Sphingobium aquiterrae]|uniref:TetR/AcrR family transcriptional regulator n=1 Tax=Sphingobium aquiterrae TaxID=2038656 RepID=UPI003016C8B2
MKVTREQAARNRETVVDTASRLFRERGVGGVGIADIMRESGLTHGGFYGQFASKEELAAEACTVALAASAEKWVGLAAQARGGPEGDAAIFPAIAANYLRDAHVDAAGTGCALVALAADAARSRGPVSAAFTQGMLALAAVLETAVPADAPARRETALAAMSQMMGALMLARAVDDPALAQDILSAARAALGANPHPET